jgi:SAM-dependent methyltransferase
MNWSFDSWPAIEPQWHAGGRGHRPDDQIDFHVDLGCGRLKKGRVGVDRFPDAGVNVVADLDFPGGVLGLNGEDRHGIAVFAQATELGGDASLDARAVREGGFHRIIGRGLPFDDSSIESMVSHHALEHVGEGFLNLIDEVWRVLKPRAPLRIITPLFPSSAAINPEHVRFFTKDCFEHFQASPDGSIWTELFSTPGYKARFDVTNKDITPVPEQGSVWDTPREIRVTLRAVKPHG